MTSIMTFKIHLKTSRYLNISNSLNRPKKQEILQVNNQKYQKILVIDTHNFTIANHNSRLINNSDIDQKVNAATVINDKEDVGTKVIKTYFCGF